MLTESPTFITDKKGKKISVILSIEEYERILEELDELDDIRLYDEAKSEDDGERIPIYEAFKIIEAKRKEKQ
ncbi:MAG TPA: hypothetical protein VKY36_05080 [Moheibacter sp.]|nr:hypothetical protein [Moheibacter sp.]